MNSPAREGPTITQPSTHSEAANYRICPPVLQHGGQLVFVGGVRLGKVDPVESPLAGLQRDPAADQRHHLPVSDVGDEGHPGPGGVGRREGRRG